MTDAKPDYIVKVILVGNSSVGKSNLITCWNSDEFSLESKATIGLEVVVKNVVVDKKLINCQIWDTAGQERFRSLTTSYYRGCHGVLLVYDVTSHSSFISLKTWLEEIKKTTTSETVIILVGNKMDLDNLREITESEGQQFAVNNNLLFMETSALQSTNVDKAFMMVINEIYKRSPKVDEKELHSMDPGTTIKIGNLEKKDEPKQEACSC